ncbi:MAG: hypothetical protein EXR78_02785 [Deltaproteobacteria bacterium]|nr:hypothetical protein [Deltaproteobacteria bacterium]
MTWEEVRRTLTVYRRLLANDCENYLRLAADADRNGRERARDVQKRSDNLEKLEQDIQRVERKAQRAWELLRTPQDCERVMELLTAAWNELNTELLRGPSFRLKNKKRATQWRQLENAHRDAEKTGQQFLAALGSYQRIVQELAPFAKLPFPPPYSDEALRLAHEAIFFNWPREVERCVKEAISVVHRLEHISDYPPHIILPAPQRGRPEKPKVNTAILELIEIFSRPETAIRSAKVHTHALLFVAGVWRDPHVDGLEIKAHKLRKSL